MNNFCETYFSAFLEQKVKSRLKELYRQHDVAFNSCGMIKVNLLVGVEKCKTPFALAVVEASVPVLLK